MEPGDYIYTTLARDILLVIAGGSRREFRAVGLPKTQSGLFAPPPPQRLIGVSLFTALDVFFTDMNISISLWHCQIVYFWRFLFVQNFKIFFGIPTSFRNWILTHPGSTKNQVSYLNKTHIYLLHQKYQLSSFLRCFWGERPVCLLGFKGASTPRSICATWPVESGTFCYLYYFSEVNSGPSTPKIGLTPWCY